MLSDVVYQLGKEKNPALLFYFAGHGEILELADGTELGYIVASDCPLKNTDPIGFDSKALSMLMVMSPVLSWACAYRKRL